jgi:hypothetical protein
LTSYPLVVAIGGTFTQWAIPLCNKQHSCESARLSNNILCF